MARVSGDCFRPASDDWRRLLACATSPHSGLALGSLYQGTGLPYLWPHSRLALKVAATALPWGPAGAIGSCLSLLHLLMALFCPPVPGTSDTARYLALVRLPYCALVLTLVPGIGSHSTLGTVFGYLDTTRHWFAFFTVHYISWVAPGFKIRAVSCT